MGEEKRIVRAPSGQRCVLSECVPLNKPISVRISPTVLCNLKCEYCSHSINQLNRTCSVMPFDLYTQIIDDLRQAFGEIKHLFIIGGGEPFLHPDLPAMIKYAKDLGIAETVETITNGTLLTHELSDRLVASGLDLLRISVNGLSSDEFWQRCRAKVDFEQFVDNIEYLYRRKGNMKIYVKIIDYMIQNDMQKEMFYNVFENISDMIAVEKLIETDPNIDYQQIAGQDYNFESTQSNTELLPTKICSMPFYTLQINEDGSVNTCCDGDADVIGNITQQSIQTIWEKAAWRYQRRMLDGVKQMGGACSKCVSWRFRVYPEDELDSKADLLRAKYDKALGNQA